MKPKSWEAKSLHEDRRVRADRVFEEITFPSSVEDFDGWSSFDGGATPDKRLNTWSRTVYLRNEENPEGDTLAREFKVVFRPGSCVPCEAWLDGQEIILP